MMLQSGLVWSTLTSKVDRFIMLPRGTLVSICIKFGSFAFKTTCLQLWQVALLSQRGRAMLRVTEYFAKSLKITQDHSKWHCWVGRMKVPISIPLKCVCYLYRFWDIQRQKMSWIKTGGRVVQGHWKRRRTIDHIRLSIDRPL